MKKLIAVVGLIGFVALLGIAYAQEEITITTYYPSPYGSYRELTTTSNTNLATTEGRVGIGTTTPAAGTKLEVVGGPVKATGGLIIETRTQAQGNPTETGRMWLII